MTSPIGSPLGNKIDLGNIIKPNRDFENWLSLADKDEVKVADGDSIDVGGRTVDALKSAQNNLKAIRNTLTQDVRPLRHTIEGIKGAIDSGRPLSICTNVFEGLALDALHMAKVPVSLAKDAFDAAAWTAVAGVQHIAGTDDVEPTEPAGPPPSFQEVNLRSFDRGHSGYFQYALKNGQIWTRYDPVIADKPFEFKLGEPITEDEAKQMIEDARGPYEYAFNPDKNSFTCTPKENAKDLGYIMRNGHLVEVPKEDATAWHLHDGNGGPHLPEGVEITKIQVAGDFIEAVSSEGVIYSYDPTKPDGFWKEEKGCPMKGKVHLPEGIRDWTLGEGVTAKPKRNCFKSMNPYTDIVGYWEDVNGRGGDFNFVATSAILSGNGREIRYRDTGLAADFSRGFLTPHNGEFEADKLAGAGSTWFVCGTDPDGKPAMYTRMYDYEMNGSCPGQHYTYKDDVPFNHSKKYDFANNEPYMPLPTWQKQEFPVLSGQACVTNHIDIIPTGQGNNARELRIEGRNAEGVSGYYSKAIDASEWQFHPTSDKMTGELIEVGKVIPERVSTGPITRDYDTATWGKGLKNAPLKNIELLDFHEFQTPDQPSTIRFTLDSGKQFDVELHTADGYTFYNIRPDDGDKVAQGAGVGKVLTGSLVIPKDVLDSEDPEIGNFVEKYLQPLDRKENQLMLIADSGSVKLTSRWFHNRSDRGMDWEANPHYDITFKRDDTGQTYYEKRAEDKGLVPKYDCSAADAKEIKKRNLELKKEMTKEMRARKRDHKVLWLRGQVTELAMRGIAFGLAAFNLTERIGHAAPVAQLMPPLMDAHERAHCQTAFKTPEGYKRAIETLDRNIAACNDVMGLNRLDGIVKE